MKNLDSLNSAIIGLELNENEIDSVGGGVYDPETPKEYLNNLIKMLRGPVKFNPTIN